MASCPIRAEMLRFMQQVGRANSLPQRRALPPTPSAKGAADEDGSVFFKLKQGSSKATVTPAGCHEQIAPNGHSMPNGIPI